MEPYKLQPRRYYAARSPDSPGLFSACWRQYRGLLLGSIDDPECDLDVVSWLDQIAAELVNDSASRFYLYG